jgi:hypothetical protein
LIYKAPVTLTFDLVSPNSIGVISGLGIKIALYPTKCKQTPPYWNEKGMFLFITFLLEMTENQIYVFTCFTILRFVRYILFVQLFCKTKVIANLQLEAGQNCYEILWIRRSSYCFINRFYLHFNN